MISMVLGNSHPFFRPKRVQMSELTAGDRCPCVISPRRLITKLGRWLIVTEEVTGNK